MRAAQIIEEIQHLPEDERGKVLDFARRQPNVETLKTMREPTGGLPRFADDLLLESLGSGNREYSTFKFSRRANVLHKLFPVR